MHSYIYYFLSLIFDKLKDSEKIKGIILFGSFARGNPRKDSDIDLFIDVEEKNKEEIEKHVRESLNEFELKSSKSWKLKGINNAIVPIVDSLDKDQWRELKRDISSYGLTLYGKYRSYLKGNRHAVLIEYDLKKLKQKNKMAALRRLYGYKIRKGKKTYSQKGLTTEVKGEKIQNGILVSIDNYKKVIDELRRMRVQIKVREVWLG